MSTKRIPFTQQGFDALLEEQAKLKAQRPHAVEELAKARAMGDLSENGYYKSARFKLSDIDRQLRHLTHLIRFADIKQKVFSDCVDIGSTIKISNGSVERVYNMVGGYESNPQEGKISIHSPLGKALTGKKKGDTIIVESPSGKKEYVLLEIS